MSRPEYLNPRFQPASERSKMPDFRPTELSRDFSRETPQSKEHLIFSSSVLQSFAPEVPPKTGVLPLERHSDFKISETGQKRLDDYVDNLIKHPQGQMVGETDFSQTRPFQVKDVRRFILEQGIPNPLSEEDLVNTFCLSYFTEVGTESFAQVFDESSKRYNVPALGGFNRKVWVPDEMQHHDPFKKVLMESGMSEEELDRKTKQVQEMIYTHTSGATPIHLTTFGMIQEYLTDHWYGLQSVFLEKVSPLTADLIRKVKKRERLHMKWYSDMTAIQVADNPDLIHKVAEATAKFEMPGNKLVPHLQEKSREWIPRMGGDFDLIKKEVLRSSLNALGNDPRKLGRVLVEIGAIKDMKIKNIFPVKALHNILKITGGRGAGIVGEAALKNSGLTWPSESKQQRSPLKMLEEKILRSPLRSSLTPFITFKM